MGAATRHRQQFLRAHPRCAFCGGEANASTIEHCPPRALFQFRHWPEGFEFPSCEACNLGTDDHDLLVAMLARMDPFEGTGNLDGKQEGLMKLAHRQFPRLFQRMMPSASEARRSNRELGLQPAPGQTHQDLGVVKVPSEFDVAVRALGRKLAKGIYYREADRPFPNDGCLLLNWFTNADLLRTGKYLIFDVLKELGGSAPPLQRSGQYLNNQFEYKLSLSPEKEFLVLQAKFGNAFGLVVFGSAVAGKLEAIVSRLREQTESDGPFAVLQSPSLT